jgi:A/G-specific adenine glycosylase
MSPDIVKVAVAKKPEFQRAVIGWAISNIRDFPWRKGRTPYRVLIAEVLLRRTTASAVRRVYENFLKSYPTTKDLANANKKELEASLSSLGYHKQRAKILKNIAAFIIREYHGKIPSSAENLLSIPHVGPYIAGAVLSFGYGVPAAIVDSNVDRILRRVFFSSISDKAPPRTIQDLANELVPKHKHQLYNFGLLDLGSLVCRYGMPRCQACPLRAVCDYPKLERNMD